MTCVRRIVLCAAACLLGSWMAVVGACDGGASDPRCQFEGPGMLELGTGNYEAPFIELGDGSELTLFVGPGGYPTIVAAIRAHELLPGDPQNYGSPDNPETWIGAYSNGELVGESERDERGLVTTEHGFVLSTYVRFLYADFDEIDGNQVTLQGQVLDVCGRMATAELDVVPVR